jgi:hypothetical protein
LLAGTSGFAKKGVFLSCFITISYRNANSTKVSAHSGLRRMETLFNFGASAEFRPPRNARSSRLRLCLGVIFLEDLFSKPLRGKPMWETRTVQINVRLPRDIADQAEEVQRTDPEFLSRVILYGLTRRSIYRHLRENEQASASVEETAPPMPS